MITPGEFKIIDGQIAWVLLSIKWKANLEVEQRG
jgi:hypothetical protein